MPDVRPAGICPQCAGQSLACKYNHFEDPQQQIDSWEHRCPDCGFRETQAYRVDADHQLDEGVDPTICPYCRRRGGR